MNKNSLTVFALQIILLISVAIPLKSQVTIGSKYKPNKGALLDLKEFPDESGGANATRGLLLPRVSLSEYNSLHPIITHSPGIAKPEYIGITIYHAGKVDYCRKVVLHNGVYVWMGTEWNRLTPIPNHIDNVSTHLDQDGNQFLASEFGSAGIWMVQNLRAKKYDPIRDNGESIITPITGPNNNSGENSAAVLWAYPGNKTGETFLMNVDEGLLYTWKGASNSKNSTPNQGGSQEGIRTQGICPNGWHLPSDKEWTELEIEIIKHTSKYANMNNIGSHNLTIDDPSEDRGVHRVSMVELCIVINGNKVGSSKPKELGGFSATLSGSSRNGGSANYHYYGSYWTASSHSQTYAWMRLFSPEKEGVYRSYYYQSEGHSVRCKKN